MENSKNSDRHTWSDEQVEVYLKRDIWPQMHWYEVESRRAENRLHAWTWAGILSGIAATLLAAMPSSFFPDTTGSRDVVRYFVVVASAIATLASGTIAPRYRRAAVTRELGRVKTTALEKLARIRLSYVPMTANERVTELQRFADRLIAIERDEGNLDVTDAPDHSKAVPKTGVDSLSLDSTVGSPIQRI